MTVENIGFTEQTVTSHLAESVAASLSLVSNTIEQAREAFGSFGRSLKLTEHLPSFSLTEQVPPNASEIKQAALKSLYGDTKTPKDSITPDACVQPYGIGNCYFVAAMASFAKTDPQAVLDMIKVNDSGTFTVKFPGLEKAINVDKPSDAEIEQVGGRTKYGVWPLVLMKAYGKYCGGGKSDIDGSDGGSLLSAGVAVFSKNGVVHEGLGYMLPLMSWKNMDAELRAAIKPENPKDALPVTASTSKSLLSDKTADGFVRSHVYSVLDYKSDPANIKNSKVTVRNPYGGADATREISLERFYANFLQLSIPKR